MRATQARRRARAQFTSRKAHVSGARWPAGAVVGAAGSGGGWSGWSFSLFLRVTPVQRKNFLRYLNWRFVHRNFFDERMGCGGGGLHMKLSWGLRRRVTSGRIAVVILLPAAVALLSGCWALAGPLIGVGAVGGGVAIAAAKGSAKQPPNTPLVRQGGDGSAEAVAHSNQPQPLDHGSGPIVAASPASTPASALSPTIAAAKGPHKPPHRITREAVAHSAKPPRLDRGSGPVMAASPASTPPATHSTNIATAKGPSRARRHHTPQGSTRAVAHSAKPPSRDHGSGPVMAASPASTLPGDLSATTIVH